MKIIVPIIIGIVLVIGLGIYVSVGMESSNTQTEDLLDDKAEIIPKSYDIDLNEGINFKEP